MDILPQKQLNKIFKKHNVSFAYLFGSQVSGKTGPLSDYDFGVYFSDIDNETTKEISKKQMDLASDLEEVLKVKKVDVVPLNIAFPALAYHIVKTGKRIYELNSDARVLFEVRAMNEYFDFLPMLEKNREYIHNRIKNL